MSYLAPLIEAQELDLAIGAAQKRAAELRERESVPLLVQKIAQTETELGAARQQRAQLEEAEEELGRAVAKITEEIEAAEVARYSGQRKNQDEASAHRASQEALREKQAGLEAQEMELLESIDAIESQIAEYESTLAAHRTEASNLAESIRGVEAEVEAETARLGASRAALAAGIPDEVLAAYERIRAQPRNAGRGATSLSDGRCTACGIKLPSLEKTRMMGEPEDALIQCPQCRRVLVR